MSGPNDAVREAEAAAQEWLATDRWIDSIVAARSLKTAFETGLVDHLVERGSAPAVTLGPVTRADARGLHFLLGLLQAQGVVEQAFGDVRLTAAFRAALRHRDLLETKLDFAGVLLDDFADHFTALVADPDRFVQEGRLFELFDYRRALQPGFENWQRTRAWMRLTSTLTRYEAGAALALLDLGSHRRLLDVGGNSGEFALQCCRRHPRLRATVFDLPLVCEIGREHLLAHAESPRIAFAPGDMRINALPDGHDLVIFKSMLHDWAEADAARFLEHAAEAVAPGGCVAVFERAPIDPATVPLGFASLSVMLFFRSYRDPAVYVQTMSRAGLADVQVQSLKLDTPFMLVTGRKP